LRRDADAGFVRNLLASYTFDNGIIAGLDAAAKELNGRR